MKFNKLFFIFIMVIFLLPVTSCASYYKYPPISLQIDDLVGVWETHYGLGSADLIIILGDGTFKQIYLDPEMNYYFETPWNQLRIEKNSDGIIRLHLTGGRYYVAGIEFAELNGLLPECPNEIPDCSWNDDPWLFHDFYADESIEMVGELVLNIRLDLKKELVLHHMSTSIDAGFALFGGEQDIFRRVK